jgi:glycosyltransferase involved in cell wall biosynthesis
MKFRIATPTLNPGPALRACVRSVQQQEGVSATHHIQDGGSTDQTIEWLRTQPRISWNQAPDCGMYDAIARAWQAGDEDILAWLNADEQYLPGALAKIRRYLEMHPEADAVFGDYIVIRPDGRALAARREIPLRRWYIVNGTLYVQSCAFFVRRRIWAQSGGFNPTYKIAGDKEWMLRLLDQGVRFRHIPEYLALFTASGRNLSCHPDRRAESEKIRRDFGAYTPPALRLLPRLCRLMEKTVRGKLLPAHIRYSFIDAGTLSSRIMTARTGSRWQWPEAESASQDAGKCVCCRHATKKGPDHHTQPL